MECWTVKAPEGWRTPGRHRAVRVAQAMVAHAGFGELFVEELDFAGLQIVLAAHDGDLTLIEHFAEHRAAITDFLQH